MANKINKQIPQAEAYTCLCQCDETEAYTCLCQCDETDHSAFPTGTAAS